MRTTVIAQSDINRLASQHGLKPGLVEWHLDYRYRCLVFQRNTSSAYGQALLSYSSQTDGPIKVFCGLCQDRKLIDDGDIEYPDIETAIGSIAGRFNSLRAKLKRNAYFEGLAFEARNHNCTGGAAQRWTVADQQILRYGNLVAGGPLDAPTA